jgi:hypothetical protein
LEECRWYNDDQHVVQVRNATSLLAPTWKRHSGEALCETMTSLVLGNSEEVPVSI